VYPSTSRDLKLRFVGKLALSFDTLWRLPLPQKRLIGELKATSTEDRIQLSVSPDRHYSLVGPFDTVADYLRAKIRGSLELLRWQNCIDEYKERYLQRITACLGTGMQNIPEVGEQFRSFRSTQTWVFIVSSYLQWSSNGHGEVYPLAEELRRAIWDAIPEWKRWNESEATEIFLEWFRFVSFMKAEPLDDDLNIDKEHWWSEHIRITESFLNKYHCIEL